ncbi:hypothetical protein SAMN05444408_101602 [Chryseobacterium takakiae]|uniref:Uncharacterized protein n=1 Tax=Chryseobacterium takakiae TaxID=1302685 RepID=A0A1M4TWT5_9FLAO|nr:hypothetical protein SAMN05444408_101602 [Chryseobacterium takakiae]
MEDGSWVTDVYNQLLYLPLLIDFVIPTKNKSLLKILKILMDFVALRITKLFFFVLFSFVLKQKKQKFKTGNFH